MATMALAAVLLAALGAGLVVSAAPIGYDVAPAPTPATGATPGSGCILLPCTGATPAGSVAP